MSEKHARTAKLPSVSSDERCVNLRAAALKRRTSKRSFRGETLEDRAMMAFGPQLVSIQPNSGDVLGNGVVRNIAPQQLSFVFDDSQQIDATSLAGIRITRAGFDNTFILNIKLLLDFYRSVSMFSHFSFPLFQPLPTRAAVCQRCLR